MAAPCAANTLPLRTDFAQLIDGELIAGTPGLDVINPATGAVFARAPKATRADLPRAEHFRAGATVRSRSGGHILAA